MTQADSRFKRPVVLAVEDLVQEFKLPREAGARVSVLRAVAGVSFEVHAGETVGIVGETGCGKSTLARAIMQIPPPVSGRVVLGDTDLTKLKGSRSREKRREIQMVFQDPYSSLDPRWTATRLVAEPLRVHRVGTAKEQRTRAEDLLGLVGLDPARAGSRRPRELSGGECQRVAIARALALSPSVLLLDEAVSSLDVSVQAQVLNLLEDLRSELGLAYVFISHDLSVVRHMSDRVLVMYRGTFCEIADQKELYRHRRHPYSDELISAIPSPDGHSFSSATRPIAPIEPLAKGEQEIGCKYRANCVKAVDLCFQEEPRLLENSPGHWVACHFPLTDDEDEPSPVGAEDAARPSS